MAVLSLTLRGNTKLFSILLKHFTFSLAMYESLSFSPYSPTLTLVFYFLKIVTILVGIKWYIIVFLIYNSLMNNNVENLFMCFLAHLHVFFVKISKFMLSYIIYTIQLSYILYITCNICTYRYIILILNRKTLTILCACNAFRKIRPYNLSYCLATFTSYNFS